MTKPFFVLAPMDDVTDVVFRRVVAECAAPDMFFTEFVNVDGLQSIGRSKLIHKLRKDAETDNNLVAQVWGKNPENFEKTAAELVDMGFAGIDINMGCPEKNVVNNGCCSALINDTAKASEIIRAVQKGVAGRVPVSVKTRLGFNQIDYTWHEHLLKHSLNMLTVHLRTRKEMSDVPAQWHLLPEIISRRDSLSPDTLIVGNGDVASREQGMELADQYGADGIMIGRGVFHDPFCFAESSPWAEYPKDKKVALYRRHIELFMKEYQHRERSPQTLRRYCKVYIHGFDGANDLRQKLMETSTADELLAVLAQE